MLTLDAHHTAAMSKADFFGRVAHFIRARSPAAPFGAASDDKPLRNATWEPHWVRLRQASERDAALFMCFLLACATLKIDTRRAAEAVGRSFDPVASMRGFLDERGLLPLAAFDGAGFATDGTVSD